MTTVFRAAWVVPGDGPAVADAYVTVRDGRIERVADSASGGDARPTDLGNVALLPGLVNPHTHLELTDYYGKIEPCPFWTWLPKLVERRTSTSAELELDAVRRGAALSLRAGVTLVGDISRPHQAWPILKTLPLRKVCFAELISYARRPARDVDELARLVDATPTDERLLVGLSPHAPYTVYPDHVRDAFQLARERRLPITIHLAETPEEVEFCTAGTGTIDEFLQRIGERDAFPTPHATPVEYLRRLDGMSGPVLLAHVNYVDDASLATVARSACSVVYCPRAHRYFGHAPHAFRRMLEAGINVALGTDSAASLPTDDGYAVLSVLDEARFLHATQPDVPLATLLKMITLNGARCLGLDRRAGSITPGKWADLVAIPLDPGGDDDPVQNVLESNAQPSAVIIAGESVDLSTA